MNILKLINKYEYIRNAVYRRWELLLREYEKCIIYIYIYIYIHTKCSQTTVSYLKLMNPWLCLLSTICAHFYYFTIPQDVLMKMTRLRTIVISTRLGVNQSTVVPV